MQGSMQGEPILTTPMAPLGNPGDNGRGHNS